MDTPQPQPEKRGRGRPRGTRPALKSILNFKGTPAYLAWCKAFAEASGETQVELMEKALERLAGEREFDPPPSRTG
jgi:hypothetical protein